MWIETLELTLKTIALLDRIDIYRILHPTAAAPDCFHENDTTLKFQYLWYKWNSATFFVSLCVIYDSYYNGRVK